MLLQQPQLTEAWSQRELEHACAWLCSRLSYGVLPADSVIWAEELAGEFIIILEGIVALHKTRPGDLHSSFSRWLRPHLLVAKNALWSGEPRALFPDGYLEAITSSRYALLNTADIEAAIDQVPVLREILCGLMANAAQFSIHDLSFRQRSQPARMARLLLDLWDSSRGHCLPYSHRKLAPLMDTQRETVTVTLHVLRDAGAISLQRRRIEIVDLDKLHQLAEEA
ncbi:MAG: Crp/Fnr family transcriptional regulator [Anaerolineales bacterium]|nr:Crp/Fnr family transcriptional regulator [Anaerolineales bacterium]